MPKSFISIVVHQKWEPLAHTDEFSNDLLHLLVS